MTTIYDDGLSPETFFGSGKGFTYDDFIILPGHIDFAIEEVNVTTRIARNLELNNPLVSSPMDTVTEHKMAIGMALHGGMGILHYNNSIEEQVAEVHKTKRYKNGFILDPLVLTPMHRVSDLDEIKSRYGFAGIPITEAGTMGSKLLGIVTNRTKTARQQRAMTASSGVSSWNASSEDA